MNSRLLVKINIQNFQQQRGKRFLDLLDLLLFLKQKHMYYAEMNLSSVLICYERNWKELKPI